MAKCSTARKECGTKFRDYMIDRKHSFMLKLQKGRGFVKGL